MPRRGEKTVQKEVVKTERDELTINCAMIAKKNKEFGNKKVRIRTTGKTKKVPFRGKKFRKKQKKQKGMS